MLINAAAGLAWVFTLGSLAALIFMIIWHWPGTDSVCSILLAHANGGSHHGFGLHYEYVPGTFLLWGEALAVLAALLMSVSRTAALRRVGHVGLIGWCSLWLANALWFVWLTGPQTIFWSAAAALLALFLAATLVRAARGWRRDTPTNVVPGRRSADPSLRHDADAPGGTNRARAD